MRFLHERVPDRMEIKEEQWFAWLPVTVDGGPQDETRWLETVRVKFQYQQRNDTREYQWRLLEFLPVENKRGKTIINEQEHAK